MSPTRARLKDVHDRVCREADRAGWRWTSGSPHPVFAAVAAEALAIIAEHGIEATAKQQRTIRWIAEQEWDTVADVVELIVANRGDAAAPVAPAEGVLDGMSPAQRKAYKALTTQWQTTRDLDLMSAKPLNILHERGLIERRTLGPRWWAYRLPVAESGVA